MKPKIVKPEVAKSAEFLHCTLISSDFLNPKREEEKRITNWQTEPNDNCEAELPDPITKTE